MKIAIIEDDFLLSKNIWKKLKWRWYKIIISNSVEEFKVKILDNADLYIIDLWLWDWRGEEIVKWIRDIKKSLKPILIMSGYSDTDTKVKLLHMWADDFISKPPVPEELVARVEALLRRGTIVNNNKVIIPAKFKVSKPDEYGIHRWSTLEDIEVK